MYIMKNEQIRAWGKLILGMALIICLFVVLGRIKPPPGIAGEVIRHNISEDIDATPIFYGDVENMMELEAGVAEIVRTNSER